MYVVFFSTISHCDYQSRRACIRHALSPRPKLKMMHRTDDASSDESSFPKSRRSAVVTLHDEIEF
ncbi:hypothetical protein OG21DRAFT_1517537 [Imleria badia]|nr:hypothetical protein OG21DRAFT_1517537 [Imleria badia]